MQQQALIPSYDKTTAPITCPTPTPRLGVACAISWQRKDCDMVWPIHSPSPASSAGSHQLQVLAGDLLELQEAVDDVDRQKQGLRHQLCTSSATGRDRKGVAMDVQSRLSGAQALLLTPEIRA